MILQSMPCNSRELCATGCITSCDIITVELRRIDQLLDVDFCHRFHVDDHGRLIWIGIVVIFHRVCLKEIVLCH